MNTLDKAKTICQTLQDHNFQAVFAGGFVRDYLLGLQWNDIDVATNATPEQITTLFGKSSFVGKQFGVVLVTIEDETFDVATFRKDGIYSDGRRPDSVEFTLSLEEDAKRRDLTINGLYLDPIKNEIIDFVGGQDDIKNKKLRFIGKPIDRIREDKIRILRAIRFAVKLKDFTFDEQTFEALKGTSHMLANEPAERFNIEFFGKGDEKKGIFHLNNPRKALNLMLETGILHQIIPELIPLKGCEQPPEFHPEGDCWEHSIQALEFLPKDASTELVVATLLHDIGKPPTQVFADRIRFNQHAKVGTDMTNEIVKRLKFSNDSQEHIVSLVANHMRFASVMKMKKSTLKRFMSLNKFQDHIELHRADCLSSHSNLKNIDFITAKRIEFKNSKEIVSISHEDRLVTGKDLIVLGLKPGPLFKEILSEIETEQLEGTLADKETAIKFIKNKWKI